MLKGGGKHHMADIHIKFKHDKDAQQLKQHIADTMKKEASKFRTQVLWKADVCHLSGPVTGTLHVQPKHIDVQISLGLLTKPFKGEISKNIEIALRKAVKAC
ncbi:MAG: polyhydroxyalkanoic acid system family protein [Myxococcota bacterium]